MDTPELDPVIPNTGEQFSPAGASSSPFGEVKRDFTDFAALKAEFSTFLEMRTQYAHD